MASDNSITIKNIPEWVRTAKGSRLSDWLVQLDRIADGGKSDGSFTPENFDFFVRQDVVTLKKKYRAATDLKRFGTFEDFKQFIEQYLESQRCKSPALKKKDERALPCSAPEAPKMPPMPNPPVKRKSKIDISEFSSDYPEWFKDRRLSWNHPSFLEAPVPPLPSFKELLRARYESPFKLILDQLSDVRYRSRPLFRARYDGKSFVADIHGCHVMGRGDDLQCSYDWPNFIVYVTNISTGSRNSQIADISGMVRIKIETKIGETVKVSIPAVFRGYDSVTILYYHINKQGRLELEEKNLNESERAFFAPSSR